MTVYCDSLRPLSSLPSLISVWESITELSVWPGQVCYLADKVKDLGATAAVAALKRIVCACRRVEIMHYNHTHAHTHPCDSPLPYGPARLWYNSVSVRQTGRLGEAGLYLPWLGFCLLVERRTKKPKCQGQASSAALSNNPLTTSWPIHREWGVFSCLWGSRDGKKREGGREQTERQ